MVSRDVRVKDADVIIALSVHRRTQMVKQNSAENERAISRDRLADLLNEDHSREYQAIIGYVVYSQVLKGAAYMNRSEEHTSELQSLRHLVCRLLLEKKKPNAPSMKGDQTRLTGIRRVGRGG